MPKLTDMNLPELVDLLQQPPTDWIVLKGDEVLVVKPVEPRPDTLAKLQQRRQQLLTKPPQIVRKTGESKADYEKRRTDQEEAYRKEKLRVQYLDVSLPDSVALSEEQDAAVFQLDVEKIAKIIHHEDLLLQRIDRLLDNGQLQTAFEAILVLDRTNKDWPGAKNRRERLLFEEARKQLQTQPEAGLAILEQLHAQNASYPGLADELGRLGDRLLAASVGEQDYRRARFFLTRVKGCQPEHAVVRQWEKTLQSQASERIQQSVEASKQGDFGRAVQLTEEAAIVWPLLPELRAAHARAASRFPSLKVGVTVLPGERPGRAPPHLADERHQRLTQRALFEADHFHEAAHYRTRYFDLWEPKDLGRQTDFALRPRLFAWESQPVLSASDVVTTLSPRLDPNSPIYDERFAAFVNSLIVRSPFEFTIYFNRVPARLEAIFTIPIAGNADAGIATPTAAKPAAAGTASPARRTYPFHVHEATAGKAVYRRTVAEPDTVRERHVAEVIELKYPSYEKVIQGLLRGDVSMLPEIPPWYVKQLSGNKDYFVLPYNLPATHVLQFHPRSFAQQNPELRRALAFALDRESILKNVVLRDPNGAGGRLVTGPFYSKNSAHNELTPQIPFDRTLAISLATVARNQSKGELPSLRVACDPDPVARAAVDAIMEDWTRAGLRVTLQTESPDAPATASAAGGEAPWDIAYRRLRMVEPLTDLWPFLTLEATANVNSLMYLPVWLRQELIELDNASEWKSAVDLLRRLQNDLSTEVQIIPLWEIDDVLVVRRKVFQTVPRNPLYAYQDIEQWILQPWYPTDTPR